MNLKPRNIVTILGAGVAALFVLVAPAAPARAGNMWFKVAAGTSGLAMDDINDGTFAFYETSINGYAFPDIDSGFSLSLHVGSDISRTVSFGFSWDMQHAHVEGTDFDVTAKMKLDADIFMGHLYWMPLQGEKLRAGAAGGLGFAAANGIVKVSQDGASYGEYDTSGTNLAFEAMLVTEYALAENKGLQLTAGWREAKVDKVEFAGSTATREDGSDLALDYTGYTFKVGLIWRFGGGGDGTGAAPLEIQ